MFCVAEIAGLDEEEGTGETEPEVGVAGLCGADNGTWWWGCNACWCAGGAVCTRLWCGLPDCLAPRATPCRTDEVSAPMLTHIYFFIYIYFDNRIA